MTSIASRLDEQSPLLSWAFSLNHRRLAVLQMLGIAAFGALGALTGLLVLASRISDSTTLNPAVEARSFTFHGLAMLFAVLLPSMSGTIGLGAAPRMVGSEDLAFPRLALASVHTWALGATFLLLSVALGGITTGWTLSVPLSLAEGKALLLVFASLASLTVSALLRSLVLATTIVQLRAPTITWNSLPPMAWGLLVQALLCLVSAPVLLVTLLLVGGEWGWGTGLFSPEHGGDPMLFQHFFWFPVQGLVYGAALPALGALVQVLGQESTGSSVKNNAARQWTWPAALATYALFSLFAWGVHNPTAHGIEVTALFGLASLAAAIPVLGVLTRVWRAGGDSSGPARALAWGALCLFVPAGAAGLMASVLSLAVQLHGTTFIIGHAHLMALFVLLCTLSALVYWFSELTGRSYDGKWATRAAVGMTLGALMAFVPSLVMGLKGVPRRHAAAHAETFLNSTAATGASLLGASFVVLTLALMQRGKSSRSAD